MIKRITGFQLSGSHEMRNCLLQIATLLCDGTGELLAIRSCTTTLLQQTGGTSQITAGNARKAGTQPVGNRLED